MTLYANVSDPDGVLEVYGTWCTLAGLCTFPTMYHMGNGVYQGNVTTLRETIGAGYQVWAKDTQGIQGHTEKLWVLYPDSLTLTLDESVIPANPSSSAAVNGTAFYGPISQPGDGENRSAPAEGVAVDVTVDGATARGIVDAAGRFSIEVETPAAEGTYTIAAASTDRSLQDATQGTLAVSTVPRPDLKFENAHILQARPVAGDLVTLEFDVKNVGSADANNVRVTVHVTGLDAVVLDESLSVPQGEFVHRSTSFRTVEGAMIVHLSVDPDAAPMELNEDNNLHLLSVVGAPAPPYLAMAAGAGAGIAAGVAFLLFRRRRTHRAARDAGGKDT